VLRLDGTEHCSWDTPTAKVCKTHFYEQGLIHLVHAAGAEIYVRYECILCCFWLKTHRKWHLTFLADLDTTLPINKMQPSLGGWSLSDPFPAMAANEQSRLNFADNCIKLVEEMNFDG
jgi:GH18 family chitinase